MHNRHWLIAAILLLSPPIMAQVATQVFVPESGFYWNPNEPGRGYAIEIQDRTLFVAVYAYTEEANPNLREPLWFTASGTLVETDFGTVRYRFDNELFFSEDGQCLGCNFQGEPLSSNTGRPISIDFDSAKTANLIIDGEVIPIERFWYTASIDDAYFALQGQWMVVTDCTAPVDNNCYPSDQAVQPFEGDLLDIATTSGAGANRSSDGRRAGTNINVASSYDVTADFFVIVVAEDVDEYLAYYFFGQDFGTDRFLGLAERYRPGDDLVGRAFPMQGYRISDRRFAQTQRPVVGKVPADSKERTPRKVATQARAPHGARIDQTNLGSLNRIRRRLEQHLAAAKD